MIIIRLIIGLPLCALGYAIGFVMGSLDEGYQEGFKRVTKYKEKT